MQKWFNSFNVVRIFPNQTSRFKKEELTNLILKGEEDVERQDCLYHDVKEEDTPFVAK